MIIKNCLVCGREFKIRPYTAKKEKWGKFCSIKCSNSSRIGKPAWNKGKHTRIKPWLGKKRPEMSNENHFFWKGDNVGYFALHHWINKQLGKPQKCEHCGKDKLVSKQIEWANKSGLYLRDLSDWLRLCKSCHKKYDNRNLNLQSNII